MDGSHGGGVKRRLAELGDEAGHARRRYELYKAKVYGPKKASPARLRELHREMESAAGRLSRAQGAVKEANHDTDEQDHAASARIDVELKRDPDRPDTKIARAAQSPVSAVREVRVRLGLYPTRPS